MRQIKSLGLALMAIFVLAGMLSPAAFAPAAFAAEPKTLPELAKERKWLGLNDGVASDPNPTLEGLHGKVECTKAHAEGTEEVNKPLGLFHIVFSGCKLVGGEECLGLGDKNKGEILSLGTWHLLFDKLGKGVELEDAVVFLPDTTHFTCGIVLIEVLGTLVCLDLEPEAKLKSHLFHCHQEKALQLDKVYWNEKGEEVKNAELKCKEGIFAYAHCAELALGLIEYLKEGGGVEEVFSDI